MVYTVRFAGGRGGKTKLEVELRRLGITQKNSRPTTPPPAGRWRRFQQTLKKWLRAQPVQPATIAELQALLDRFEIEYNTTRPHRSLAHRATPAAAYAAPPESRPRRPQHRHPRPGPRGPGQQNRQRDPSPQRPPAPHRPRPDLRRNLRPAPRPRPRHHHHRHRHRRTPPRTRPRPIPRLPAHRTTTRTNTQKTTTDLRHRRSVVRDVLRHHSAPPVGVEPTTFRLGGGCSIH